MTLLNEAADTLSSITKATLSPRSLISLEMGFACFITSSLAMTRLWNSVSVYPSFVVKISFIKSSVGLILTLLWESAIEKREKFGRD